MNNTYTNLRVLAVIMIIVIIITVTAITTSFQKADAAVSGHPLRGETSTVDSNKVVINHEEQIVKAPIATSGTKNVHIVWWSNKTGNSEVMFKASTDGGKTFGENINLSNSTDTESVNAEVAAAGNNVYVSWWERNTISNEPVMRISNDNGKTFGPILKLSASDTLVR